MGKMRAVQVSKPNGPLELVQREIPEPTRQTVRIRVHACGVCHSDSYAKEGTYPGTVYPRIPGHEVAGVIDALGEGVTSWKVGQRVGVGWFGGCCTTCESCRRGDFINCQNLKVTGLSHDGGYADYMIAPVESIALIPDQLSDIEAGPLMCAGITTFNALRNSGARTGDTIAILGVGGLGHLAVQFASKMGFNTIAIARGEDKRAEALQLGAKTYIDSLKGDPGAALAELGGAKVILSTVTDSKTMGSVLPGLSNNGKLILVGASQEPIGVNPMLLLRGRRSIAGWASGTSIDSQDAMNFAARQGVRSQNEVFSLEKAAEAYDRMMSGKARYRIVLKLV